MLTLTDALALQGDAALAKTAAARSPGRYLVSGALAGAYIGLAVILMLTAAGPLDAAGSEWTPLVQGAVFGIGLVLVVFAGGELGTSAMMILAQGVMLRRVRPGRAAGTLALGLGGNLLGALLLAFVVHGAGTTAPGTSAGEMLAHYVAKKSAATGSELFFRAVLCNVLVCVAVWAASRMTTEIGKIVVLAWCLFAFVTAGFEHVVANMTTFALGLLHGVPDATVAEALRNLLVVGAGNLVGGAVVVGAAYVVIAGRRTEGATTVGTR
ncbi:formate/nitrite transporter family protein [Georgenia faecalis]|uniref:Formate/nitrite transporter family protein n=1 Tax=Georgenia faecalis TaxID=2483799 RepID=A0ABV9D6P5_9MICO|nr:formate/nitrite transporter family protein [Georgenia faecalis]